MMRSGRRGDYLLEQDAPKIITATKSASKSAPVLHDREMRRPIVGFLAFFVFVIPYVVLFFVRHVFAIELDAVAVAKLSGVSRLAPEFTLSAVSH